MAINKYNRILIKLSNIEHNLYYIKDKLASDVKIMAVVKDNAYGHGFVEISKVLEKQNIAYLALHSASEAVFLRENDINLPMLVIGPVHKDELEIAAKNNITISIYNYETFHNLHQLVDKLNIKINVHLTLDTGMNRLGFSTDEIEKVFNICNESGINIVGLMSHMPDSRSEDTIRQIEYFSDMAKTIKHKFGEHIITHLANSSGTIYHPDAHCDMVRVGLSLYGYAGSIEYSKQNLKPVMEVKTEVVSIREVKPGMTVGYNRRHSVKESTKIAVVPIGYADGYLRTYKNYGQVLINESFYPIVGDICMDMMMLDVSKSNVKIGDTVTLLGKDGNKSITAYDIAEKCDTIPYEILTLFRDYIPRTFI
ncbi:MAG: alanine racemase [Pseudomonadota bacterium]